MITVRATPMITVVVRDVSGFGHVVSLPPVVANRRFPSIAGQTPVAIAARAVRHAGRAGRSAAATRRSSDMRTLYVRQAAPVSMHSTARPRAARAAASAAGARANRAPPPIRRISIRGVAENSGAKLSTAASASPVAGHGATPSGQTMTGLA